MKLPFFRSAMWQRAFGQYLYLISMLLVQLGAVLLLPRLLGTERFAVVAYGQAFAIWVGLIVEFGFAFSAARAIAAIVADHQRLSAVVARIRAANYVLAAVALVGGWLVGQFLPLIGSQPAVLLLSLALGLSIGLTPWWYFQGREQVWRLVFWELGGAVIILTLWLLVLREQPSPVVTLSIQLLPRLAIMAIGQWLVWRDMHRQSPNWSQVTLALRESGSLFVFVVSVAFYTTLNVLLLGFYVRPVELALFAAAEKLLRFVVRVWEPLNRLFYPQSVRLMQGDMAIAIPFVRRLFWVYTVIAVVLVLVMYQYADVLIIKLLGESFSGSIDLLHVLLLAVPVIAMSNVLGMLYLLPAGRDKIFNAIIMGGGFLHLLQSFWLVHQCGVMGMVLSLLITESLVTIAMLIVVFRMSWGQQLQPCQKSA